MLVTKKKRVSKKSKKSWRKYADIKDVEKFLEEQRQEERIGIFEDKKDEELFIIDDKRDNKCLSERQKRKLNALKSPLNLKILENVSNVTVPLVQRKVIKQKKNGRNIEEEVLNPKNSRHFQANKDRFNYYKKLAECISKNKSKAIKHLKNDLWEEQSVGNELKEFKHDTISRELALHNLKNTGRIIVKANTSYHKTIGFNAFEQPHSGMSYNPSLKDHQNLLNEIIQKEEEKIAKEQHLKRVTTNMFSKVTNFKRDDDALKELLSGLPQEDDTKKIVHEPVEEATMKLEVKSLVEKKKKSMKARRKEKEQKVIIRSLQLKKREKKQITDFHRLRHLQNEVDKETDNIVQLHKSRKLKAKQKKYEPKRLSKTKFEELDIDINNVIDIAGNLRNVKPESSLLVNSFKNFQRKNILPTTVDVGTRKKKKIKRFTRSSHKEN